MKRWLLAIATAASMLSLTGCGYNDFQRLDETTKSAWSEVVNQYQRRADLIDNLVNTVKGEAKFEQDTLNQVIAARAKATSIQVTPETLNNPEAFKQFQAAQGELSSALSRLMVTVERYPDLKASENYKSLMVQEEGTENRINEARRRYNESVHTHAQFAGMISRLDAYVGEILAKLNELVEADLQEAYRITSKQQRTHRIEEIAAKDVPAGKPFEIVDAADIPEDRTFRNAWEYV